MSRRTLIDAWVEDHPVRDRSAASRAGEILLASDPIARLTELVVDDRLAAGTRYRTVLAVRRGARQLVRAELMSGVELLALEAVDVPDRSARAHRPAATELLDAATWLWPTDDLRRGTAVAAIALVTIAGRRVEQVVTLEWSDIDLQAGSVEGAELPLEAIMLLREHQQVLRGIGHERFVFPALQRGAGASQLAQPPRPSGARTLHRALASVRTSAAAR